MAWRVIFQEPVFGCVENEKSPIGVVGIPIDHTSTYRPGSRFAPAKIREASCNIELYSLISNLFLDNVGFRDYFDLQLPPSDIEHVSNYVRIGLKNILEEHRGLLIILGGEHLLTYFSVKSMFKDIDTLVIFDAHLDTRKEYLGSTLNHATFLRRLLEEYSDLNVVHIGSRAYSREEIEFISKKCVKSFNVIRIQRRELSFKDLGRIYISVDMDVFDPAYAPGVSSPEPFGIDPIVFMDILKHIYESSSKIVAVDIVEVNPLIDPSNITSTLAAKIVLEVSGLYIVRHKEEQM